MFDITDRRLVQLERIYRTYRHSLNFFGLQPPARSAMIWFLSSFIVEAIVVHQIMAMGVHSLMVPLAPFFVAAAAGTVRYVTFPYKYWYDRLDSLLSQYDPLDHAAFLHFEASVSLHGFSPEDVLDWVCAERTALANAEHAARARAIVDRIVND